MTSISVDMRGVDDIVRSFNAKPAQISRARKRAMTKTLKTMQVKGRREMAIEHHIPLKALRKNNRSKGRLSTNSSRGGASGRLWFGVNPIKASFVGRLKAAPAQGGAFAKDFFFPGGFIVNLSSGHRGVFARTSDSRYPITDQTVALPRARQVVERIRRQTGGLFQDNLQRELNYEVNVRGRN